MSDRRPGGSPISHPLLMLCALLLAESAISQSLPYSTEARLYTAECAACHGTLLQGGQGPSLLVADYVHGTDDQSVIRSIKQGFPAKGMPAWSASLSDETIVTLVQFIRQQRFEVSPSHLAALDKKQIGEIPAGVIDTEVAAFRIEIVGESAKPWGIARLPSGILLMTEEQGALRVIENGQLRPAAVNDTPIGHPRDKFHRVLLDVAVHPDYRRNGWIYLTCGDGESETKNEPSTQLTLVRGRIRNNKWSDSETLVRIPTNSTVTGRMAFDGQGHVYLTTSSDAGVGEASGIAPMPMNTLLNSAPQDLKDLHGKILRYNDDGSVPSDNPFASTPGAVRAIWSYGHRDPQGLAVNPGNGQLWSVEHGPRGGDELNIIYKGRNYGWPVASYGTRYDGIAFTTEVDHEGMERPVINWTPSIAVSVATFYSGSAFPHWNQNLLVGSLLQQELFRIKLSADRAQLQESLVKNLGRIRGIAVGSRGEIYLALELRLQGLVVRLVPR